MEGKYVDGNENRKCSLFGITYCKGKVTNKGQPFRKNFELEM